VAAGQIRPRDFTIASVWARFSKRADPFGGVLDRPQDPAGAFAAVDVTKAETIPATESHRVDPSGEAPARSRSAEVVARSRDPKLGQYLKMRDFGETPEPAGGGPSPRGDTFVIQRHDATRLHYDLRLERDGVLVSWAVPKGLPFEKGIRHLAVQTEDHPMEYGSFSGSIPKGHYGAGEVRIWDNGTYDLLEWADKKVSFRLHGERHRGEYHLVKTRGERDWLILMASASEEAPVGKPPSFTPMLATGGFEPFDKKGWWFEPKLDGIRTLLYLDGESVRLISRTGRDQTAIYPELGRLYRRISATNAVLDGEVVATDAEGQTSFELLQQRMNLASPTEIERIRKKIPVELVVFDLLWVDGQDVTGSPLSERRERLRQIVLEDKGIRHIYSVPDEGLRFYQAAVEHHLEGVIAKRAASRYLPGSRTDDWRKIKILTRQDCVILGWTPGQGGRGDAFGALVLGAYRKGRLRWIGQVGTGFTERMLADITVRLKAIQTNHQPIDDPELARTKGVKWVKPELVCDVEYLQVTAAGKLRAPSFKGLRPDKLPEDCVLEEA
jgi:bifunctional non-homologous end joining protein LigD